MNIDEKLEESIENKYMQDDKGKNKMELTIEESVYILKRKDFNTYVENKAIETLLTAYEKEKKKNKELLEQNKDMKSLFHVQSSIAKELDFNTNEKMVKFKDEYYVPDTMAINANIGEPKTIELRYISATKYLTKFDMEE